jgi:hypothetical protein
MYVPCGGQSACRPQAARTLPKAMRRDVHQGVKLAFPTIGRDAASVQQHGGPSNGEAYVLSNLRGGASLGVPCPAEAQDAAESAIILSGTGQAQGPCRPFIGFRRSRRALNRASAAIQPRRSPAYKSGYVAPQAWGAGGSCGLRYSGGQRTLAGTDAPTYKIEQRRIHQG